MIGQTVANYRIIEFLGDGGTGSVYSAEDLKRHRLVALKIISPELARDQEFCRRLEGELDKASGLNHPGIPRIYEQGLFDAMRFIVMQLLDGPTLETRIKRGPIPIPLALQVATEATEALAEAHRKGLIHRDLKPASIVISGQGIKLLGLGHTPLGLGSGEPSHAREFYMSPEQISGLPADARSDIFSMGVILYEMVTRHRPFSGENPASIRRAILTGDYEPPTVFVPALPGSIDRAIARALRPDPAERHGSAEELLADLRDAGGDVNALLLAKAPLTRRRRRHFGTLVPTAATILVLLLVWLLWQAFKVKVS
jgi:eukaryotic-like serine/threonine-protein kinase